MLTNTELDFIRQNYQILGGTDCARKLNRSRHAVVTNAKAMGLDLTHEHRSNIMKRKLDKPFDERNVNPSSFIIPEQMDKVNAYLLGFTATPPGCREATIVSTNNRPLAEFLNSMDYITKSSAPATKILNFIPQNLRRYWWLGCMDGDGCFSFGKIGQEIGIHSSYTQDWTHAEQLAKQLGIDYHLERRIAKRGKSSAIRIIKKESCSKFIHYLYPTGYEFGLCRKHQKATQMLERCESIHIVCPHCSGDIYLKCSDDVTCFHCKKDVYLNNFVKSRVLSLYSSSLPSTRQP